MKRIFVISTTVLLILGLILKTETVTQGVSEALVLCVQSVIPALFPFFVISGIMVNTGIISLIGKWISPVARCIFGVSGKGAVAFLMGLLCGYPTGAKVIADMYKNGAVEKKEAESLLAFCNNSGPLFVIGAVGTKMLGNHTTGVVLYVIHAISATLCAVVFGLFSKRKKEKINDEIITIKFSEAVAKGVEQAVVSILNVCGYVVFFACITSLIKEYISDCFALSLIEVTQGAKEIILAGLPYTKTFVLLTGVIGFGGICVLFQVMSIATQAGLSVKKYFLGKILQGTFAMIIAKIFVLYSDAVPVFAPVETAHETFQITYFALFLLCGFFTLRRLTKKT